MRKVVPEWQRLQSLNAEIAAEGALSVVTRQTGRAASSDEVFCRSG